MTSGRARPHVAIAHPWSRPRPDSPMSQTRGGPRGELCNDIKTKISHAPANFYQSQPVMTNCSPFRIKHREVLAVPPHVKCRDKSFRATMLANTKAVSTRKLGRALLFALRCFVCSSSVSYSFARFLFHFCCVAGV